jgi:signal transduction histidine kinase
MRISPRPLAWTPATVSWLSFVLVGLVVAGIGLSGTAYVVGYLRERLTLHGIEHNRAIATRLQSQLESELPAKARAPAALQRFVEKYGAFGYRVFILSQSRHELLADSGEPGGLPKPIASSWLASALPLERARDARPLRDGGPARARGAGGQPLLLWIAPRTDDRDGPWVIGVASDPTTLTSFLGDLHWHLDGVMLLTYVLIGILGLFTVRGIGRAYERRLESQVRERTEALEAAHAQMLQRERLATIGQTASVLAHEMRNPLASIKLALSGAKGLDCLPERERRRVELVAGEVDRLENLLSQTLDYVRPIRLASDPVLLDDVLTQVLHQEEPSLARHEVRIRRERCRDCRALPLDAEKMHQVLLNLLKNALDATPPGGEIGIRLFCDGAEAVLTITNGGEPLSEETLASAFEPFFTTKPEGSGLGLGLVRRVVEAHGGTVVLTSDHLSGTCATVRLPMP